MARSRYTREMFTNPDARVFTIKNPNLELYYYKSNGGYFVQIFKPRATRSFEIIGHTTALKRKDRLRNWISKQEADRIARTSAPRHKARATQPRKIDKAQGWNVADIVTAKPKQHTHRRAIHCTSDYTPLNLEKKGIFERAKRALFG